MRPEQYDVLVVGSGPAGSIAGLVLARGGAKVALVDKARFPRDKACGDLVGPRGVQTLTELGIPLDGPRLGDMDVIGPSGRRVRLPARQGRTYPGHAIVAPRVELDHMLRQSAIDAGAEPITGRVQGSQINLVKGGTLSVDADVVIGADGALSRVGAAAGLVNDQRALWGFALRAYLPADRPLPEIYFWEPSRWRGYPGYGWAFPGSPGTLNIGLGLAARGDRKTAARVARDLPEFVAAAGFGPGQIGPTLGGWLKMGMTGTVPAAGRTLLVGDAAGLVNPLQGEGIAQALASGRAAAEAVLTTGPDGAAARYRDQLARWYGPHAATTSAVSGWMTQRPRAVAAIGRLLTAPGLGAAIAGGWGVYWNDLLDGAAPGWPRVVARAAAGAGRALTARAVDRRELRVSLSGAAGGS